MAKLKFYNLKNTYFCSLNVESKCSEIFSSSDLDSLCSELRKKVNYPMILIGLQEYQQKLIRE